MSNYILAFKFNANADSNAERFAQEVSEYIISVSEEVVEDIKDIQVGLTRVEEKVADAE